MHPLIEQAKVSIRDWSTDDPRDVAIAAAKLLREILDVGDLPDGDRDWQHLRNSFDIKHEQPIGLTLANWDDQCRLGDFDMSKNDDYVNLGIVTWTVKKLLKQFGMLSGSSEPPMPLEDWKANLIDCLERYIIVSEQRTKR